MSIQTANGSIELENLGKTLMHEHLVMAMSGWDSDTSVPRRSLEDTVAICVDSIEELKAGGFSSLLDPCPMDIGRDVELYGEVAVRTGFNIMFSTGIYNEHLGGPYWRYKVTADPAGAEKLAELYIRELTDGIGPSRLRPAVIKLAIGENPDSVYEAKLIKAAAIASNETGAPILAHTEGVGGDLLLGKLAVLGVEAHRIIVGHSCGSSDHDYHRRIVDSGAYIGFDRFGLTMVQTDEVRIAGMHSLIEDGYAGHLLISHDCTFCQRGRLIADEALYTDAMHYTRNIEPLLRALGVAQDLLDSLVTDNPRSYFAGDKPVRAAGHS